MLETLETPVHSAEKKLVLKAIDDSSGQITVADIATETSLPVLKASSLLNQIAYETGGHITVGTAGSVAYEFANNFQTAYLTRGSKNFFLRMSRIFFNAAAYLIRLFSLLMFFLIRVSFGIILILSVVVVVAVVVVAVIALFAKMMGNDNDSAPDFDLGGLLGGIGGVFRYWAFDWLWDWWYWGSYLRPTPYYYPERYDSGYNRNTSTSLDSSPETAKKDKESFLDKCFSFLFGDGDPNAGLEERYWRTVASVLKANGGVVVAEQLAPYALSEGKNEDWVLPILVRFNGNCDVSENGNIIYSFPSFQQKSPSEMSAEKPSTAVQNDQPEELHALFRKHINAQKAVQQQHASMASLETYLKEQNWQLSHVSDGTRAAIITLALVLIIGGLWLTTMVVALPFLLPLIPVLLCMSAYGAMFLIVPGIRYLIIKNKNEAIERRNAVRYTAANKLSMAADELKKKLEEAEQARRTALEQSSTEEIAYTTEKDYLEQQFDDNKP